VLFDQDGSNESARINLERSGDLWQAISMACGPANFTGTGSCPYDPPTGIASITTNC